VVARDIILFKALTILLSLLPMKKKVTPYADSKASKKKQVTRMFDAISGEYDLLNRIISLGIDVHWRKKVVRMAQQKPIDTALDIATGTGDLAIALSQTSAQKIVGLDISPGMLALGKEKIKKKELENTIEMVIGDSEALVYETNTFDLVTVAFGVRNFENLEKGLKEIYRVLKPEGTLLILETSVPTAFPFKQFYQFYTGWLMPNAARLISKDKAAYHYLAESAAHFPYGSAFNNILTKIGFIRVASAPQTFGVATIYCGTKPKT
jgi:demethylmenaquinone methyltransferase/2-methoxy-6-polyprenyl-1,4-benzoquinol methylase